MTQHQNEPVPYPSHTQEVQWLLAVGATRIGEPNSVVAAPAQAGADWRLPDGRILSDSEARRIAHEELQAAGMPC